MCFMYGGVTSVSDGLNLWELMSMAELYQMSDLQSVLALHFKAKHCHFFHRVGMSCSRTTVAAVFHVCPIRTRESSTFAFVQTAPFARRLSRLAGEAL